MARPLVKTHIRGFDEDVLRGGIPQGHVVLVRGATGTMKSSLAYYVLYHNALEGAPGLYVTLEQTAAGLLEHVAALGLKARSEEHTSELQSRFDLVCRRLLEKKNIHECPVRFENLNA